MLRGCSPRRFRPKTFTKQKIPIKIHLTYILTWITCLWCAGKNGTIVQTEKNDIESRAQEKFKDFDEDNQDPALAEFEKSRREYINTMKRIRLENPDITPAELEMKAREEVSSFFSFLKNIMVKNSRKKIHFPALLWTKF